MKPVLLVLAAGMGSRYGGLKQLDPVGPSGETIMDYSVYDAIRAGFGKVVFVIRRDIEDQFREQIGSRYAGKVDVDYAFQELDMLPEGFSLPETRQKPWGTGHAALCAADKIDAPFVIINADDFYGASAFCLMADYFAHLDVNSNDYAMCGYILRQTLSDHGSVARGICKCGIDNFLSNVEEMTKIERAGDAALNRNENGSITQLTGDEIVSLNYWGFTPTLFKHLDRLFTEFLKDNIEKEKAEFFLPFAVNDLIKQGIARVKVLETPDSWFGVTYRPDREKVEQGIKELVAAGKYPASLF
jgi:UTP-glucose-1-phosphate uridylyltransferase